IHQSKNDFLKKVINYSRNDMVSKILLMQQFIMMSKPLTCIWGLSLCVMENCKGKTCLIVKNCYGYKINSTTTCINKALSWNVERKAINVNISKQKSLKNRLWKKRLLL